MSASIERATVRPAPVDVPVHGADGSARGSRTFTAGPVAENYPNVALLKEAVRRQQGRLRRGTASTKTRGEINGTPKKPWRQKGTGRARAGSKKSPIWRGGGIVFGPKPRTYDYGLPRKQRRLAIRHAMLSKLLDGETKILESLPSASPSAASVRKVLSQVGLEGTCLIGLASATPADARRNVALSCRNIRGVQVLPVSDFDALSLLRNRHLVLLADAFDEIQQREQAIEGGEER